MCRNLPYTVHQRTIPKKKIEIIFFVNCFVFKKMGNIVFDLHNSKYIFLVYLHIKLKKKNQRKPSPWQAPKMFFTFVVVVIFRVAVKIFWCPATKEKGIIKTWHFGAGFQ